MSKRYLVETYNRYINKHKFSNENAVRDTVSDYMSEVKNGRVEFSMPALSAFINYAML